MNLLKPRFTIAGLLILIMLCAFAVENRVSSYRQQVVSARKIEKLGGEVLYGWHNPTVKDSVWFASSARPEIRNDGKRVMIPYTNPVPLQIDLYLRTRGGSVVVHLRLDDELGYSVRCLAGQMLLFRCS